MNIGAITSESGAYSEWGKNYEILFACDSEQRIDTGESQMSNWAGLILGQIPHSKEQRSSQIFKLTGTFLG